MDRNLHPRAREEDMGDAFHLVRSLFKVLRMSEKRGRPTAFWGGGP